MPLSPPRASAQCFLKTSAERRLGGAPVGRPGGLGVGARGGPREGSQGAAEEDGAELRSDALVEGDRDSLPALALQLAGKALEASR